MHNATHPPGLLGDESSPSSSLQMPKARQKVIIVGAYALAVALLFWLFASNNRSATNVASEDPSMILEAGLAAHNDGHLEEAKQLYLQVLDQEPDNYYAIYNLGVLDHTTGKTDSAESRYRAALKLNPSYSPAQFNLATILASTEAGRTEAVEFYRKVIAAEPENAGAIMNLGVLLHLMDQPVEGEELIKRASRLDPSLARPIPAHT